MRVLNQVFIFLLLACVLRPATWYVDGTATGTGSGTSWANACTTFVAIYGKAVTSGDTVYISGGSTGNSQEYDSTSYASYPGQLFPPDGTTWQIGQDSAHNGTAIFNAQGGVWLQHNQTNVTISGDAGDGQCHFYLKDGTASAGGNCNYNTYFRVSYVDFGQQAGNGSAFISFNPGGPGIRIDHCKFYLNGTTSNTVCYAGLTGTTYGDNSFDHNTAVLPRYPSGVTASGGNGPDGLEWSGTGFDINDNTITAYAMPTWDGNQHQDGWQGEVGTYVRIYNNTFVDMTNYCVYAEPYAGSYTHMRIYNNLCVSATITGSQAIVVAGSTAGGVYADDVVVANNLAENFSNPFTFRNPSLGSDPTAFINCYFYNNVSVGTGSNVIDAAVTSAGNVSVTTGNAATYFTAYTAGSASNDYHLTSSATPLIGTGTDASAYIGSLDKDGTTRTGWDLGPYDFASGGDTTAPSITITAPTSSPTLSTYSPSIAIGGTASDNVSVSSVTVVMSGATTGSVTISGTTTWAGSATVNQGDTLFTAMATDSSGNTATDTLTITYGPAAPASVHQRPAQLGVGL